MMMMVDANFSSRLSEINRATNLAAQFNTLAVNNDGSETPWWSNVANDTAWKGANLKRLGGNGTTESMADTVFTPLFGGMGYRPSNLGSTYDQERRIMILAMNAYINKQDASGLVKLGLPVPDGGTEQTKQLISVRDNLLYIESQSGQTRSNLSVEKYAKEGYSQYLQQLSELQAQSADVGNGIINAQTLATKAYAAQEQATLGTSLKDTFENRIAMLSAKYSDLPELAGILNEAKGMFTSTTQAQGRTGFIGPTVDEKESYQKAMTFLMDKLDQTVKAKSAGTRTQDVLDTAFKGTDHKDVAALIDSITVLAGGTQKGAAEIALIQKKRMAEAGFATQMDPNKVYQLAEGSQASNIDDRQKKIKDLGGGQSLWRGADGNVYFQETKYDADGIRSTSSRLYQTEQSDEQLAATKKISDKNLAQTGKVFVQRQNADGTMQGNLYAIERKFSDKSTEAIDKAKAAARKDKLENAIEIKPEAIAPKVVASTDNGDIIGSTLAGAGVGASIGFVGTGANPFGAAAGAFIGGGIGMFSSFKTKQPTPLTASSTGTVNASATSSTGASTPTAMSAQDQAKLAQLEAAQKTATPGGPQARGIAQNIEALNRKYSNPSTGTSTASPKIVATISGAEKSELQAQKTSLLIEMNKPSLDSAQKMALNLEIKAIDKQLAS